MKRPQILVFASQSLRGLPDFRCIQAVQRWNSGRLIRPAVYMAFQAMLTADLDGVANQIEPGEPLDKDRDLCGQSVGSLLPPHRYEFMLYYNTSCSSGPNGDPQRRLYPGKYNLR
jgi:hypothetical protein